MALGRDMSKWTHATQPPRSAMAAGKLVSSPMAGPSPEAMMDRLAQAFILPPSKSVMPSMAASPPSSSVMLQALQELPPKRVYPSTMQPPLLSLESPRAQRPLSPAQPTKKPCWQRVDAAPARHKKLEESPTPSAFAPLGPAAKTRAHFRPARRGLRAQRHPRLLRSCVRSPRIGLWIKWCPAPGSAAPAGTSGMTCIGALSFESMLALYQEAICRSLSALDGEASPSPPRARYKRRKYRPSQHSRTPKSSA